MLGSSFSKPGNASGISKSGRTPKAPPNRMQRGHSQQQALTLSRESLQSSGSLSQQQVNASSCSSSLSYFPAGQGRGGLSAGSYQLVPTHDSHDNKLDVSMVKTTRSILGTKRAQSARMLTTGAMDHGKDDGDGDGDGEENGEELRPITKELAEMWRKKQCEDLLESGYIRGLRVNEESGCLEELLMDSKSKSAWRKVSAPSQMNEDEIVMARLRIRIDADKPLTFIAILLASCATLMLIAAEQTPWGDGTTKFGFYVMGLAAVIGMNLVSVIISSAVTFTSARIMSQTSAPTEVILKRLKAFWTRSELARSWSLDMFHLAAVGFLVVLALRSYAVLDFPANVITCSVLLVCAVLGSFLSFWLMWATEYLPFLHSCQACGHTLKRMWTKGMTSEFIPI